MLNQKGKRADLACSLWAKKRDEWEEKCQAAGEKAERDLDLVKTKCRKVDKKIERWKGERLSKMKRNRADRGGDDTQHVEDRKKGRTTESRENMRTRGPARDLNNQQFFPLVFWYIA